MRPKEILKIKKLIDSLNLNLKKIEKNDIAYHFIEQAVDSLQRKISRGENPYKMTSYSKEILSLNIDFLL